MSQPRPPRRFDERWRLSRAGIVNVWFYLDNEFSRIDALAPISAREVPGPARQHIADHRPAGQPQRQARAGQRIRREDRQILIDVTMITACFTTHEVLPGIRARGVRSPQHSPGA
jgi:hypothetical protein